MSGPHCGNDVSAIPDEHTIATAVSVEWRFVTPLRRILRWSPHADGRIAMLVILTAYFATIAAGRLVWGVDLWPSLGVPSGPSLFFDARNLTAAWESARLGYDPLYESPCDPWARPMNYLRPWLLLGVFGLDQSDTLAFAGVLVGAMFVSFGLFVGRIPIGTGLVLAIAACSPAVMFAVERANMDIALFSLLTAALLVWQTFPSVARVMSPTLTLLAAAGKVYPAFALPAFIASRSPRAARVSLLCVLTFAVFLTFSYGDIAHIARIAPQGVDFSYGARILLAHLYHQVGADRWPGPAVVKQLVAALTVGGVVVGVALWVRRRVVVPDARKVATARLIGLHIGALVYLGTFAVGNNFDYRLVFLLLTLPQLIQWVCVTHRLSSLAGATLLAILVLLWVGSLSRLLVLWDELASWIVAGLLTAILTATLPRLHAIGEDVLGHRAVTVDQSNERGRR